MISVSQALAHLFDLCTPLGPETVPLADAAYRTLNGTVTAVRDQPPFSASAMDGYAIPGAEIPATGHQWAVIGESSAGHGFHGTVGAKECVRIFTGAPLPQGTDRIVIQEDVDRNGDVITLRDGADTAPYVRPAGADFSAGSEISGPQIITPARLSLFAAMNASAIPVTRRPVIAIIGTGDELIQPGEIPNEDQIVASNIHGLGAMIEREGGIARILPIARDRLTSLETVFDLAQGCDLIVTIGGASVGDHDLVSQAAANKGMEQAFYKVAMRPGKPLMAGHLAGTPMIGLPGNPVSALVCGQVFLVPVIRYLLGHPAQPSQRMQAILSKDMPANGPREHYMRATVQNGRLNVFERQDSSLLSILSDANALLVRVPNESQRTAGEIVDYIPI